MTGFPAVTMDENVHVSVIEAQGVDLAHEVHGARTTCLPEVARTNSRDTRAAAPALIVLSSFPDGHVLRRMADRSSEIYSRPPH